MNTALNILKNLQRVYRVDVTQYSVEFEENSYAGEQPSILLVNSSSGDFIYLRTWQNTHINYYSPVLKEFVNAGTNS